MAIKSITIGSSVSSTQADTPASERSILSGTVIGNISSRCTKKDLNYLISFFRSYYDKGKEDIKNHIDKEIERQKKIFDKKNSINAKKNGVDLSKWFDAMKKDVSGDTSINVFGGKFDSEFKEPEGDGQDTRYALDRGSSYSHNQYTSELNSFLTSLFKFGVERNKKLTYEVISILDRVHILYIMKNTLNKSDKYENVVQYLEEVRDDDDYYKNILDDKT